MYLGECFMLPKVTHSFSLALTHSHIHRPQSKLPELESDDKQVMYDLDDLDLNWLESVNQKRKFRG